MTAPILFDYTAEVLSFDFKDAADDTQPPSEAAPDEVRAWASRTLDLMAKAGKTRLVLFGLGSGAEARALFEAAEEGAHIRVCELSPARVRTLAASGGLPWLDPEGSMLLAADTSPWALLLLLHLDGLDLERTHLVLNPNLDEDEKMAHQALQRLVQKARPKSALNSWLLSHVATAAPSLSVAAILHPDEPDLPGFFAQLPDWVGELALVWDADEVPANVPLPTDIPVVQTARPLNADFSAQRNAMLELCSCDWVLFLDADERLEHDTWSLLPALLLQKDIDAYHLPRKTLYPDEAHCRIGLGLWPDLQLRLFRRTEGLSFINPVHERLSGVSGAAAIVLDAPIMHLSHLLKKPDELRAKLAGFDRASAGGVEHVLSEDYPNLACARLGAPNLLGGMLRLLLLPTA